MTENTEHLKREIEELERQIASHPFEGLFDRKRLDQLQDRLKKKRKELARLEIPDDDADEEIVPSHTHFDVPGFVADAEDAPDLGHAIPVNLDLDDELVHPAVRVPTPPMRPSPGAKVVAKAKPKAKPAAKPAKKSAPKAKAKPKPVAKKKAPKAKPKKKSKR
jgi:hypothetical protein